MSSRHLRCSSADPEVARRTPCRFISVTNRLAGAGWFRVGALVVGLLAIAACGGKGVYKSPRLRLVEPPPGAPLLRLLLIGDAGEIPAPGLKKLPAEFAPGVPTVVAFLGDNVYPAGVPLDDASSEAREILTSQVDAAQGAARIIFVPGNHDWNQARRDGYKRVLAQQQMLTDIASNSPVSLLPRRACPGPEVVDFGDALRLVAIDTEWLLASDDRRPSGHGSGCVHGLEGADEPYDDLSPEAFYRELGSVLSGAGRRRVVVVAHHPLRSHGQHAATFTTNFPVWLYQRFGFLGLVRQDLGSRRYQHVRQRIDDELRKSVGAPVVYASGHEHTLQILGDGDAPRVHYLVSGSAAKRTRVGRGRDTLMARYRQGYLRLDVLTDGQLMVQTIEPDESSPAVSALLGNH